jgi:tRNA-2-methylthio-N6-dimethylallyladenosine synthase
METMKLYGELKLDLAHIAKYSPRPRTVSSKMPDDVSDEEKESRLNRFDELVAKVMGENNAPLLGTIVEVLAEEFQASKGRWRGRTPQNKLVFFEHDGDCLGQLVKVKLDWTGPFSLIGRAV